METRVASHPLNGVSRLVRRPVLRLVAWARQGRQAVERLVDQLREVATLVLRGLDGVVLQATQVRSRSQLEMVFGSLTVSIASGVAYARPGAAVPDVMGTTI